MKNDGWDKKNRCKLCNMGRTQDGHDPCIARLPGVEFACCGHGETEGYIKFIDGRCLRFMPWEVDLNKATHVVINRRTSITLRAKPRKIFKFNTGKIVKTRDATFTKKRLRKTAKLNGWIVKKRKVRW